MKYDDYAEALGFNKINKVYTLKLNGFHLYLKDYQYMILSIASIYIPLDKALTRDDIKDLQIAAYANACFRAKTLDQNDTLIITLPEGNKQKEEKQKIIKEIMQNVVTMLQEKGYKPLAVCPICKNEANYEAFGDNFIPMHEECKNKYLADLKEKSEKEKGFQFSYVLSVILAILGVCVGLLPVILLTIFINDYFTGLIALGPLLASLSTLLAKAPKKKALNIVLGAIIFVITLSTVLFTIFYIPNAKNIPLSEFIINNGAVGLRKIIFGSILSLAGFGILRFLSKFKINYTDEIKKFEE